MSRAICPQCDYPQKTCVCDAVQTVISRLCVDILQHPAEAKCAKNTGRLLALCMPNATVWQGENEADFSSFYRQLQDEQLSKGEILVLYPSADSFDIKSIKNNAICSNIKVKKLIVIDATWRKAFKMWQLNPRLHALMQINLGHQMVNKQGYQIRKTSKPNALSTLEATAQCLQLLEPECNLAPLYAVFDKMQQPFLMH